MQQRPVSLGRSSSVIYHDELLEFDLWGSLQRRWRTRDHLNVSLRDITCRDTGHVQTLDIALHGNALDWDPEEGRVVYNARNLDTFYAIDWASGQVQWSVGRLGSLPTRVFGHPHNVQRVGRGRYLLFDNQQRCTATTRKHYSRVLELAIDPRSGVEVMWTGGEVARLFTPYGGSCARLLGGHVAAAFSSGSTLLELDGQGRVVRRLKFVHGGGPLGQILFARFLTPFALPVGPPRTSAAAHFP
eukprot:GGOE01018028.1.p2 GENE.GGOE01018028.1~~GGOE01018028.1.p2  ORF type:complete len:244 (+),score=39.94 GGOE01018028.1:705-1436(+)